MNDAGFAQQNNELEELLDVLKMSKADLLRTIEDWRPQFDRTKQLHQEAIEDGIGGEAEFRKQVEVIQRAAKRFQRDLNEVGQGVRDAFALIRDDGVDVVQVAENLAQWLERPHAVPVTLTEKNSDEDESEIVPVPLELGYPKSGNKLKPEAIAANCLLIRCRKLFADQTGKQDPNPGGPDNYKGGYTDPYGNLLCLVSEHFGFGPHALVRRWRQIYC